MASLWSLLVFFSAMLFSEIFDADPPHHPRGCVAQAWGVAEILRVMVDYELYETQQTNGKRKKTVEQV